MLNNGVNIFEPDSLGEAPIHSAIEQYNFETVKFLLEKGCDPDQYNDEEKELPLHMAIRKNLEIVELLIKYGADLNFIASYVGSPLHMAITKKNSLAMKLLIDSGANSEIRDTENCTPIEYGLDTGNISAVNMLLFHKHCLP